MARWKWSLASLIGLVACSPSGSTGSPQPEPVFYEGNTERCGDVREVCLETSPPQCFEYCADQGPKKGSPCTGSGDVRTCGDLQCVVGEDAEGHLVQVCVGMDCSISYDATTGKETIDCGGPSDAGVADDAPGSVEGSPGN